MRQCSVAISTSHCSSRIIDQPLANFDGSTFFGSITFSSVTVVVVTSALIVHPLSLRSHLATGPERSPLGGGGGATSEHGPRAIVLMGWCRLCRKNYSF